MIPKIIHYCWFGGNPLPELAVKCIDSWKKFFPDYEIKEWNEKNFNLSCCEYIKEAYEKKMWAFVSDYARFKILYEEGGLYFDTDVEVIKSFEEILALGSFMGKEASKKNTSEYMINPGLGLAATPGMDIYKEILDYYNTIHFDSERKVTVCFHVTNLLKRYGYIGDSQIENMHGIAIYPPEYFCPKNYYTGELNITEKTFSIHQYSETWHTEKELKFIEFERKLQSIVGINFETNILIRVLKNLYCFGMYTVIKKTLNKIRNSIISKIDY